MRVRCPMCGRSTAVDEALVEHLNHCQRCGALVHVCRVEVGEMAGPGPAGGTQVVARAVPRLTGPAERVSTGVFTQPRQACLQENAAMKPEIRTDGVQDDRQADPLAALVAAQERLALQRTVTGKRAWRNVFGLGSLIAAVVLLVLGFATLYMDLQGGLAGPRRALALEQLPTHEAAPAATQGAGGVRN